MRRTRIRHPHRAPVSVPFNAGRGLMPPYSTRRMVILVVSVPFNAGRGLMPRLNTTAKKRKIVSVPFNAGRGLMPQRAALDAHLDLPFQYPSMRVVD